MNTRYALLLQALLLTATMSVAAGSPWVLETIAGGGPSGPAVEAFLDRPSSVAIGPGGEIYASTTDGQLVEVDTSGQISVIVPAGTFLADVAVDAQGAVYFVQGGGVFRVDPASGSPQPVLSAGPEQTPIAIDEQLRVYYKFTLGGFGSDYIVRFDPSDFSSTPILGCYSTFPCPLFSADGQSSGDVIVGRISDLAVDTQGNLFIAAGPQIFRIDLQDEKVFRYAGTGQPGFSGDGGPATAARVNGIDAVAVDSAGNLFLADTPNARIRRVDVATGIIDTIAGISSQSFSGDGGAATAAALNQPRDVAVGSDGSIAIADWNNNRVRRIDPGGIIETIAGSGLAEWDGSETTATNIALTSNSGSIAADGSLIVAGDRHIYGVDLSAGTIRAIAGTGNFPTNWIDGVDAMEADITPTSVVVGPEGDIYFVSTALIHRLDRTTNQIMRLPNGSAFQIAFDPDGNLLADTGLGVGVYDFSVQQFTFLGGAGNQGPTEGIEFADARFGSVGVVPGPNGNLFLNDGSRIWVKPDGDSRIFRFATGSQQLHDEIGPLSPFQIPLGNRLGIALDEEGSALLHSRFFNKVYRVDHLTGDAVRIVGQMPGTALWIAPVDATRFYVGTADRVLLVTNTSSPPEARIEAPLSAQCTGPGGATIHLDASASFDPDDLPGEPTEINLYRWYEDYGLPTETLLGKSQQLQLELPTGVHDLTLLVRDFWGTVGTETISITVYSTGDLDGDGIDDCTDNCSAIVNSDQEDTDQNGVGDACDPCLGDALGDLDADGICGGSDNCPLIPNPAQSDDDSDGVGNSCDECPVARVEVTDRVGSCVLVPDIDQACVPVAVDSQNSAATGQIRLDVFNPVSPTEVTLELLLSSNSVDDRYRVLVNGQTILDEPSTTLPFGSPCSPRFMNLQAIEVQLLESAWIPGGTNEVRFVKTGTSTDVFRASIRFSRGSEFIYQEVYELTNVPGCVDGVTDVELDVATGFYDEFSFFSNRIFEDYGPGLPQSLLDAADLGEGTYELCISSTDRDDPGTFLGATSRGQLIRIDPTTGAGTLLGAMSFIPDSMAYDPESKRLFAVGGKVLREIDPMDGLAVGARTVLFDVIYGLEFVDGDMIGATNLSTGSFGANLGFVNYIQPDGSAGSQISRIDPGWIHSLSYDPNRERIIANSGSAQANNGGTLVEIGLDSSVEVVGPVSPGWAISVGPDNQLYSTGGSIDGTFYRQSPAAFEPMGDVGFTGIRALTTIGSKGYTDCTRFQLDDGQSLAINESCGGPIASIAPAADAACDSPQGAVITLDGSGSSDPNDPDDLLAGDLTLAWYEDYGTIDQILLGTGDFLQALLPVGSHAITLEATNRFGEIALAMTTVSVLDDIAPEFALTLDPVELWPPNNKLRDITADWVAGDNCGAVSVELVSITSNQGDIGQDVEGADYGTNDHEFRLRASRSGRAGNRLYTVTYKAVDVAGNATEGTAEVFVPHDQSSRVRNRPEAQRIETQSTEEPRNRGRVRGRR